MVDDSRFPAHANTEIAKAKGAQKAELKAFWEAWAAVGDAKAAKAAAFVELQAAEERLKGVPTSRRAQVVAKVKAAEKAHADADHLVAAAIRTFKAGG